MAKFVKLSKKRIINIDKINCIFEDERNKGFLAAMDTCSEGNFDDSCYFTEHTRSFLVHLTEKEVDKIMKASDENG
ncbi:hypothetical protein ACWCL1_05000 [Ligilactobacillus sp. LYQ135]